MSPASSRRLLSKIHEEEMTPEHLVQIGSTLIIRLNGPRGQLTVRLLPHSENHALGLCSVCTVC